MPNIIGQGKMLAIDAPFATTFLQRLRGFMFSRITFGSGLIFVLKKESIAHASIHMLFVFGKLDVLWLNKHKRVISIRRGMLPFIDSGKPSKPAKYIIELPAGVAKEIRIGTTLRFEK